MNVLHAILAVTARVTTPILLASTGAIYSERSGLPNITLDAAMILGAFSAVYGSYFYANVWAGVIYAMLAGTLVGILYALVCVFMGGDATVVGVSFNLIAWGLTTFLLPVIFNARGSFVSPQIQSLDKITLPLLNQLPLVGGVFSDQTIITYFSWLFVFITWLVLFHTKPGMQIRACGENPQAAATVGFNVSVTRFVCSGITGMMCGLAGAHLSLGLMTMFSEKMTAGRGFIALAAVTYAKASPKKVLFISLIFGFADALSNQLQLFGWPSYLILMVPYLFVVMFVVIDPFFQKLSLKKKKAAYLCDIKRSDTPLEH